MKKFRLNRRAFLGGAGAMVALPMLEAMIPNAKELAAQQTQPTRMLAYYVPCGIYMERWTPVDEGRGFTLSPLLQPLADFQDDLLVLSGLNNTPAIPELPAGDHPAGTGAFLTATQVKRTQTDIENAISVDQVAAQSLVGVTRYASLQLGIDGGESTGNCDSGYSCAYARNVSWAGPKTPLPKQVDPQIVFDRLFGGLKANETAAERAVRKSEDLSVLDYVVNDVERLNGQLGMRDRQKMDEYLTAVRELEMRIEQLDPNSTCGLPPRPGASYDVPTKARIMSDLMVTAFECDVTRVISFMLANAGSYRAYDFLGISERHHQLSHHQGRPDYLASLEQINLWEMEQLAYLVRRLKETTDAMDRPLLDSTSIFFSSEIADGQQHNHTDMPVLMVGGANGYFDTGRHVRYAGDEIGNLFVSWLDSMEVPVASFGESGMGPLSGLT